MADGLFGNIYDAQLQQQLLDQKAAQSYGTGWEAITRAAAGAGGMLGRGVSKAFGGVTPMEAKQAKFAEIHAQFADADITDPDVLGQISNALIQGGLYEQGYAVQERQRKTIETRKKSVSAGASTEFERHIMTRAMECDGDPACLQKVKELRDAHYANKARGGDGTEFERYIQKQRKKCNGDPACLAKVAEKEEKHYMKGTDKGMKQWQYEAMLKSGAIDTAAQELGITLTPEQKSYIQTMAKDELIWSPETGQLVDSIRVLLQQVGTRDPQKPSIDEPAGAEGFIETPASLKIKEQKEKEEKRKAAQAQREQERLDLQKRAEARQIDQQKKDDLRYIEQRREKLSADLSGENIPELESSISEMESLITKFEGNLPGINIAEQWLMDEDTKAVRSAFATLRNAVLKDRSGAAVTNPEFERLQEEIKGTISPTDADVIRWVGRLRNTLEADKANIFAGYGESVKEDYWKSAGSVRLGTTAKAPTPPLVTTKIPRNQILEDAKRYGWTQEQTDAAIEKYGE